MTWSYKAKVRPVKLDKSLKVLIKLPKKSKKKYIKRDAKNIKTEKVVSQLL